jgi:hypothetical protein
MANWISYSELILANMYQRKLNALIYFDSINENIISLYGVIPFHMWNSFELITYRNIKGGIRTVIL